MTPHAPVLAISPEARLVQACGQVAQEKTERWVAPGFDVVRDD